MWLLRSPARLLVLLAAAWIVHASAQLTDAPLRLPGRPAPQSGVTAAAGASQAEERAGYFGIPGTQRRLFYWFFQVGAEGRGRSQTPGDTAARLQPRVRPEFPCWQERRRPPWQLPLQMRGLQRLVIASPVHATSSRLPPQPSPTRLRRAGPQPQQRRAAGVGAAADLAAGRPGLLLPVWSLLRARTLGSQRHPGPGAQPPHLGSSSEPALH